MSPWMHRTQERTDPSLQRQRMVRMARSILRCQFSLSTRRTREFTIFFYLWNTYVFCFMQLWVTWTLESPRPLGT